MAVSFGSPRPTLVLAREIRFNRVVVLRQRALQNRLSRQPYFGR
jgi:hypothetical protein